MINNIEIIETEIGKIPVIVKKVIENDEFIFEGKFIDNQMKTIIKTPTKESCLEGLKGSFEVIISVWLDEQLEGIK